NRLFEQTNNLSVRWLTSNADRYHISCARHSIYLLDPEGCRLGVKSGGVGQSTSPAGGSPIPDAPRQAPAPQPRAIAGLPHCKRLALKNGGLRDRVRPARRGSSGGGDGHLR